MTTTTGLNSVDDYIARQPLASRGVLELVRGAIRKAVPNAEELISYKMPAYKLRGDVFIYFAGWKQHYSLYPATNYVISALRKDLAAYDVNKSTIRFQLSKPVPVKLIGRIVKSRAKEAAERRAKAGAGTSNFSNE